MAWIGTRRHTPEGDLPYCFCYLLEYTIDLPAGAMSVTLPSSLTIRVTAMTVVRNGVNDIWPAGVLYESDAFPPIAPRTPAPTAAPLAPGTVAFQMPDRQTL